MKPLPAWIRLFRDEQGVGSVLMIILLPMFIGLAALAIDGASAYRMQTILQSTADASAHAAAIDLPNTTNAKATAVAYAQKNLPVAANGNVLVNSDIVTGTWDVTTRTFTAGATPPNAVQVTVRRAAANGNALPTSFLGIIGRSSWDVSATAIAARATASHPICVLTFQNFTANGGPAVDFSGCLVMSDGDLTCNGFSGGDTVLGLTAQSAAVGSVSTHCSPDGTRFPGVSSVSDPYASATDPNYGKYPTKNIPANPCTAPPKSGPATALNYSWEPTKKQDPALSAFNQWTGTQTIGGASATTIVCGDLQLTGNVTLNTPSSGGLLVIENGKLDLNGFSLTAANGSPLTVIFTGDAADTHQHSPWGNGALSFDAPPPASNGGIATNWHGVALYQDPRLTAGLDFTATGSQTTWFMSGLVYMPNANLTYSGAVNKRADGTVCFVTIAKTVLVNGQGRIYQQTPDGSGCQQAGLDQPGVSLPIMRIVM